jgi:hypothetical protein
MLLPKEAKLNSHFPQHKVYAVVAKIERYGSPVTGLRWPRGFQEVRVSRFLDNNTGWW